MDRRRWPLHRYSASAFALGTPPTPTGTVFDPGPATAVSVDAANGDVYVDEGDKVSVFDSFGAPVYDFGSSFDFGTYSAGVAFSHSSGKAYVADPVGSQIDVFAAAPAAPAYDSSFGAFAANDPQALTVDPSNGDIYAVAPNDGKVFRFDSTGAAKDFTAGPDAGSNVLTGFAFDTGPSAAGVAIDRSGGSADGDVYVASLAGVSVFGNDGAPHGTLDGSTTPNTAYSESCGVGVDQSNGDVYVGDYGVGIWRYSPSTGHVTNADYSGGIDTSASYAPCQVAADSGKVYAAEWTGAGGPLHRYSASAFALGTPPTPTGTVFDPGPATAVSVDAANGDVYVDEGDKVSVFDSFGAPVYDFGSSF